MIKLVRKQIEGTLAKLADARRSGNAEAVQKAYEELFALCHENHLDLRGVLREWEERQHPKVA